MFILAFPSKISLFSSPPSFILALISAITYLTTQCLRISTTSSITSFIRSFTHLQIERIGQFVTQFGSIELQETSRLTQF